MARLLLPRRLLHIPHRPVRVEFQDDTAPVPRTLVFDESLRLGYGEQCEIRLDGERGPEVVCSIERPRGPLRVWTPRPREEWQDRVDVLIDGRTINGAAEDIQPGSRVEVVDRETGRRYRLIVEPKSRWFVRPRYLAAVVVVLALAGVLYGAYVYYGLRSAKTQLVQTEERLREAEQDVERSRVGLREVERRITSTESEFGVALRELREAQTVSERAIRTEFDIRLAALTERAEVELARISELDVEARKRLQAESRAAVESLSQELEERMVFAYQEFKGVEERLTQSVASRIAALEPTGARFKRVFQQARAAIVFVLTSFEVEFLRSGEVASQHEVGTGFFITASGMGMTAQHVVYPWRYDRELQVLLQLGLVKVREETAVWSIWTYGQQVLSSEGDEPGGFQFERATAWRSDAGERALRLVYAPSVERTEKWVEAPIGVVPVSMPVMGPSDVAVFQIMSFTDPTPALSLSGEAIETLDEAVVIGYPLSRLDAGRARPQAVTGFVRRATGEALELNTALNPGISGAPILNPEGQAIGMAIGVLDSEVYGLGIRAEDLARVVQDTIGAVKAEEFRLQTLGCDPGVVDGVFDEGTWDGYRCESRTDN